MTQRNNSHRALIVTAHPDQDSATITTARAVADGLRRGGATDVVHHDLVAAGFDTGFGSADLGAYRSGTDVPADVRAEQEFLDGFDTVAIVFPVYWWSLPGALKGWIDRVFTRGWIYDDTGTGLSPNIPRNLYFFGIGATGEGTYRKRGYADAMRTQLVEGIGGYIGVDDSGLVLLYDGESSDPAAHREREVAARDAAEAVARATIHARAA